MALFKKNKKSIKPTNDKINEWEKKLRNAIGFYQDITTEIDDNYEAYKGTRAIYNSKGQKANKDKTTVRKVTFELIESQIDVNIPQPKITSVNGNIDRAQIIEHYIKNELDRLPFEEMNDEQGRITPIAGASIFLVEWDNSIKTRNTIGKLTVKNIHPNEIVPQPGVYKIQDMDYIFMRLLQSKIEIKQRYGVDVTEEANTEPENDPTHNDELVTHYYVYYKNDEGYISLFSWVNNTVIQDIDNYFARKHKVCERCGAAKGEIDKCEQCGNTTFKLETLEKEKLTIPRMIVNSITNKQEIVDEEVEVPYYVPKKFPFVIRKNASELDNVLGNSDVSAIKDQQNDLNIYTTKIREKLLKGGSIVTLPKDLPFKANDDEMKIVRIDSPAQKDMIDVKSLQPNVANDIVLLDKTYDIARQTIGITDSFQGRRDNTALSGKAKEFAAQQTAGRLESKRIMKNFAFSQLFEVMFQFILAYADEPRKYHFQDDKGNIQYRVFDKRSFLDKDDNGKYYYDDEFIFAVDESAILSTNRRAMWEETRLNFTSGAYGDPRDLQTIAMFWQMMDSLHYPGAKQALQFASQRVEQQRQTAEQQQVLAAQQAGNQMAVDALGKMNKNQKQAANKTVQ
jgi:ribosomal protein S27AE